MILQSKTPSELTLNPSGPSLEKIPGKSSTNDLPVEVTLTCHDQPSLDEGGALAGSSAPESSSSWSPYGPPKMVGHPK